LAFISKTLGVSAGARKRNQDEVFKEASKEKFKRKKSTFFLVFKTFVTATRILGRQFRDERPSSRFQKNKSQKHT
jgi:hypothetical protein